MPRGSHIFLTHTDDASFFSTVFRDYLASISHVGTIAHYTIEQLKATPISLPIVDEQQQIGAYFANLDELITLHQRKCLYMSNIRKTLGNSVSWGR